MNGLEFSHAFKFFFFSVGGMAELDQDHPLLLLGQTLSMLLTHQSQIQPKSSSIVTTQTSHSWVHQEFSKNQPKSRWECDVVFY